ncbi:tetratricopeptide repeat protein [Labrys wisconsinensis]|uniref:Tetratricopeptide repeat protein 38 n=1 Tax=Labrys wisconsinensis TaxID=425677 RepID=A0ABU0JAA0_9HYPH|nr:tetratricopeptide repeat protein [Labrys wisconsinensis]MDQ0471188.1 tetratricopeptide (TPR) repeat protein [Labrys wisconsinensis]
MSRDSQGLAVTGGAASAAALDRAVADYYAWKGDPVATLQEAVAADPAFTLGHSAIASLLLLNGLRGDNPAVTGALGAAQASIGGASPREQRHLAAARAWAAGEIIGATDIWEDILVDHPTDALALRFAHDSYFYLGHSLSIRDSVARVLPAWDPQGETYGYVLGQYAFGLEEAGELRRAEEVGRAAIARNGEDGWAVHAVAHVLETESRQAEGIDFLKASRPAWSKAHALSVHNGWHLALYLIEEGRFEEVLADYDRFVAPKLAGDSLLDLVDAAALLWRLELAGGDAGDRWQPVAEQWLAHVDDHVLAFNDLHIALAVSRAGDRDGVLRLRRSIDAYVRHGRGDNRDITADVGLRLIEGVLAFAEGDHVRAIERILPIRYKVIRIGGSHAQRDLVTQTLIAAAQRAGRTGLARALLAERLAVRPTERTRRAYEAAAGATVGHG